MKAVVATGLAALLLAAAPPPAAADHRDGTAQFAQLLKFDIFRRDGFPLRTCEFRCQERRNRCEARAQTADERRDCRLSYNVCSDDCDIYTPGR